MRRVVPTTPPRSRVQFTSIPRPKFRPYFAEALQDRSPYGASPEYSTFILVPVNADHNAHYHAQTPLRDSRCNADIAGVG